MVRLPRYVLPGHPQHIIQRGNSREPIFYTEDDYLFFRQKLLESSQKHGCKIHAYVMMPNHVHLLITPLTKQSISKLMQSLGRYYVQYVNNCYDRSGTLWEGRYKATLIDSNTYLLECMRYIELNPVRTGLVRRPGDYPWSSYKFNATGSEDSLITPHQIYQHLGQSAVERKKAYRQLFAKPVPAATLNEIRDSTNKAWVLGSKRFRNKIQNLLGRRATPKPRGGDRKSAEYRRNTKINRV